MFSSVKKIIALTLVVMMMLLVGCGGDSTSSTDSISESSNVSDTNSSQNVSQTASQGGEVDSNVVLDTCNRMVEEGKFYYKHEDSTDARIVATQEMVRNSVPSTKITLSAASRTAASLVYNVNGVTNNVGFYVYLESSSRADWVAANSSITIKLYNGDSKVVAATATVWSYSVNAGWNFIKLPFEDMTVNGETNNITKITVEFSRSKTHTNDIVLYMNGLLCDSKMKPAILISFDGLYSADADNGGKFDVLEEYNVPFTIFCNSNLSTNTSQYNRLKGFLDNGSAELQLYGCRDINGYAALYNLTDVSMATVEKSTVLPEHQYEMVKYASDMLRAEHNANALCYAGKQGNFSGITYDTISELGYKLARVSGHKYVGKFTENDLAMGYVGYYTTTDFETVQQQVEYAIRNGCTLGLFTHEVTVNGTQYGTTKEKFKEVIEYLVEKRNNGEIEILNYGQFLNSCY